MSILGKVSPASTDDVLAYVCPTNTKASLNLAATNRGVTPVDVTLSLSKSNDLAVGTVTVVDGGSGLKAIPTLSVAGDGYDAAISVASMKVTELSLADTGTGYVAGNVLEFTDGTTPSQITVDAVDVNGAITAFTLTSAGAYTSVLGGTTVAANGGEGTGALVNVGSIRYGINAVTLVNPGNNYTAAPTITASAGNPTFSVQMVRSAIEPSDAIEYRVQIPANGVLERTGITIGAGDAVFVKSSIANTINMFVFGITAIA